MPTAIDFVFTASHPTWLAQMASNAISDTLTVSIATSDTLTLSITAALVATSSARFGLSTPQCERPTANSVSSSEAASVTAFASPSTSSIVACWSRTWWSRPP